MKPLLLLLALIFSCTPTSAQRFSKRCTWGSHLEVGTGRSNFGDSPAGHDGYHDSNFKNYYAEYERQVTRHFSVAPAVSYVFSGGHWDTRNHTPEAVTADMNIFFSPIRTSRTALKVGYGWSRRYDQTTQEVEIDWHDYAKGKNYLVGLEHRIGNVIVGVRHSIQKYRDDERLASWNVGVGFKL